MKMFTQSSLAKLLQSSPRRKENLPLQTNTSHCLLPATSPFAVFVNEQLEFADIQGRWSSMTAEEKHPYEERFAATAAAVERTDTAKDATEDTTAKEESEIPGTARASLACDSEDVEEAAASVPPGAESPASGEGDGVSEPGRLAFTFFKEELALSLALQDPDLDFWAMSEEVARQWEALTAGSKAHYFALEAADQKRHV